MKKFIVYVLCLFLPVYGCIAVTNYIVDPGNIYSEDYVDKVIEGARQGLNVTNVEEMDHRMYKRKLAELYKGRSFDYLVLGSSRIMTVSSKTLGGASLLNLAVTKSITKDFIAMYEICKENDIHYKNVIIGVDPTLFNGNYKDDRWKSVSPYYYRYYGVDNHNVIDWELIMNLFSASYFKNSLRQIPQLLHGNTKMIYTKELFNEKKTRCPDGSHYYGKDEYERTQKTIDRDAAIGGYQDYFLNFDNLSVDNQKEFEKIVKSLQSDGHEIFFFLCPYHPLYYDRIVNISGVRDGIDYIRGFANKMDIKVIGDFNPHNVSLSNECFHDKVHLKKEYVDHLFEKFFW